MEDAGGNACLFRRHRDQCEPRCCLDTAPSALANLAFQLPHCHGLFPERISVEARLGRQPIKIF